MAKVLAELSAKPLAGSELQRGSCMGLGDFWRLGLGLVGRKEEQELAQAGLCLAGCVIRDACSALRKSQNSSGCVERDITKPDLSARRACGTG